MDRLDAYVTEILSKPTLKNKKWVVKVKFKCYTFFETELRFETKKEAEDLKKGHHFLY